MKVVIITPLLANYYLSFWEGIKSRYPELEITIVSESSRLPNRESWTHLDSKSISVVYLSANVSQGASDYDYNFAKSRDIKDLCCQIGPEIIIFNNLRQLKSIGIKVIVKTKFIFLFEETSRFFFRRPFLIRAAVFLLGHSVLRFISVSIASHSMLKRLRISDERIADCSWMHEFNQMDDVGVKAYDLCFVGQFIPRKGFDNLVNVIPDLICMKPELRVLLMGGGELIDVARSLEQRFPNHVDVLEDVPSTDVCRLLRSAKFLILPSREDIYGMVVLEALSSGAVPIVSSDVGSHFEILKYNCGVVLTCSCPLDAGELVKILDSDQALVDEWIAGAKSLSTVSVLDQNVIKLREIFEACVSGK